MKTTSFSLLILVMTTLLIALGGTILVESKRVYGNGFEFTKGGVLPGGNPAVPSSLTYNLKNGSVFGYDANIVKKKSFSFSVFC